MPDAVEGVGRHNGCRILRPLPLVILGAAHGVWRFRRVYRLGRPARPVVIAFGVMWSSPVPAQTACRTALTVLASALEDPGDVYGRASAKLDRSACDVQHLAELWPFYHRNKASALAEIALAKTAAAGAPYPPPRPPSMPRQRA